jgi:hypothetical protein
MTLAAAREDQPLERERLIELDWRFDPEIVAPSRD